MRKIIAYKGYYQEFMSSLSDNERKKIMRALLLFETEEKMPHHYIVMDFMSLESPMAIMSFDYFSFLTESK